MRLFDCLIFVVFAVLSTANIFFPKLLLPKHMAKDLCLHESKDFWLTSYSHVCEKKIKLHQASVSDFALINGVSVRKARLIVKMIKSKKKVKIKELMKIKGIGVKTLAKLDPFFEP